MNNFGKYCELFKPRSRPQYLVYFHASIGHQSLLTQKMFYGLLIQEFPSIQ
jgi:hypothetical protein